MLDYLSKVTFAILRSGQRQALLLVQSNYVLVGLQIVKRTCVQLNVCLFIGIWRSTLVILLVFGVQLGFSCMEVHDLLSSLMPSSE